MNKSLRDAAVGESWGKTPSFAGGQVCTCLPGRGQTEQREAPWEGIGQHWLDEGVRGSVLDPQSRYGGEEVNKGVSR